MVNFFFIQSVSLDQSKKMSSTEQQLDLISSLWKHYIIDNSTEYFSYNVLPFLVHQFAFYLFNFSLILFFIFKFKFIEKFNIHKVNFISKKH